MVYGGSASGPGARGPAGPPAGLDEPLAYHDRHCVAAVAGLQPALELVRRRIQEVELDLRSERLRSRPVVLSLGARPQSRIAVVYASGVIASGKKTL